MKLYRVCRRCRHPENVHQHWRHGTDCGRCGPDLCPDFRPRRWWHRR